MFLRLGRLIYARGYLRQYQIYLIQIRNQVPMDPQTYSTRKTNGRWTQEEHDKFILGLQLYGKDWKKIEQLIMTRNGAQIRSHAQKFFIKLKKDCEGNDLDELSTKYQQQNVSSLTTNSKSTDQDQRNESCSFLSKIFPMSSLDADQMDFWDSLVEQPSSEGWIEQDLGIKGKRKSSFVSIGEDSFSDYFRPNTLKRVKV